MSHKKTKLNSPQKASIFDNSDYIIKRLREISEPIKLFNETDYNRIKRLKLAELNLHEKKTTSKGTSNLFKNIQAKVEAEMDREAVKSYKEDDKIPPTFADKKPTLRRKDFECAEFFILAFFHQILNDWKGGLAERSREKKRSAEGKKASATLLQTRDYLAPFFAQLETRECSQDIVRQVESIALLMQRREYLRATNEYLTMSIGKAPWPMGLTMVSIHERKGRSKIYSSQIAHILNDEETRKYIQSIKRLLTFCQEKYPPDTLDKKF